MSVKFANCAKEKSEMFYRLCLLSGCNKIYIYFQCMKNIYEHLTIQIVPLYILNSLL